jgi:beta-lactamase class A
MKKTLVGVSIVLVLVASLLCFKVGCGIGNVSSAMAGTDRVPRELAANPTAQENRQLDEQIKEIASAAKGRVGVAAVMLDTGEATSLNLHDHFPMHSVYKLPIAMAVLHQIDQGKLKLDQIVRISKSDFVRPGMGSPIRDQYPNGVDLTVSELIRFAVSESDGTASDVLIRLVGGTESVQAYLRSLGITEMVVANTEKGNRT